MTAGMPSESRIGCKVLARTRPRQVDSTAGVRESQHGDCNLSLLCVLRCVAAWGERLLEEMCEVQCNEGEEEERKKGEVGVGLVQRGAPTYNRWV